MIGKIFENEPAEKKLEKQYEQKIPPEKNNLKNLEKRGGNVEKEKDKYDKENKENEKKLNELREKVKESYKKDEETTKTEEPTKFPAGDIFEMAEKIPLPKKAIEYISNISEIQKTRDETAKRKIPEMVEALKKVGINSEKIETLLSLGAGWGENIRDLAKELKAEKIIGIDKSTIPSESVKEAMGKDLAWIEGDAMKAMRNFKNMSVDLSELTAFLQVLNEEDKIKVLKEVGRISKFVVIVDEIKRSGLKGVRDWTMNKLYNAGMGKYETLDKKGWEGIFEKAGLEVKTFNEFGKNDFVAVLQKIEKNVEE